MIKLYYLFVQSASKKEKYSPTNLNFNIFFTFLNTVWPLCLMDDNIKY